MGNCAPAEPYAGCSAARTNLLTRRGLLALVATGAASAVLGSCQPAQPQPAPRSGAKAELVYQDWRTDWFPPMAQQLLDQFHAKHPNIRVFYTPDPENLEDRMLSVMQAGTAPDVFQGCCETFPIWAQLGYTLDLRPFVQADLDQATIDDWDRAQYRSFFTRDGRQYGLPKYLGALALFYNRDLFDEFKVDYPNANWTHDDYLTAMRQLTGDRDRDGKTDLWGSMLDISWERLQIHVNEWGGHFVDPNNPERCAMGDPECLAALEWIRARMWDDRVMATFPDINNLETRQAFASGRLAMVEEGSWALKDVLNRATFRMGVTPFPTGPVRRATLASSDGFGIYAGTRNPDAAWELVKFLTSKDTGRIMARAHLLQPARASLVDEWARLVREEFPRAADLDVAAFADGQLRGYSVTGEIFPANMAEAKQYAATAWQRILTLGQASVQEMKGVCSQIQRATPGSPAGGQQCCGKSPS